MTREQHLSLCREHQERAMAALKEFGANHSRMDKWQEYEKEMKLANKHWGIAQAMYTKQMRKINPSWL